MFQFLYECHMWKLATAADLDIICFAGEQIRENVTPINYSIIIIIIILTNKFITVTV